MPSSRDDSSDRSPPGDGRPADCVTSWTAACPIIDPSHILRMHGYTNAGKIRPILRKTATTIAAQVAGSSDVQGCWRRVAIEAVGGGEVRLADATTFTCAAFDRLLAGAHEAIVFLLTLGQRFDQAIADRAANTDAPLDALFLETAGRLAIEKLTRLLAADIGRLVAADGCTLGTRMGPGYSYRVSTSAPEPREMWPLEQQAELFRLFGMARLPVELTASSVMRPRMSRSGLFGVRREKR